MFDQLLIQELLEFDLERYAVDLYIFRRMSSWKREVSLIVVVYVDDSKVTGKPDECKFLREHLDKSLVTKNLGALSYYIGGEYRRDYKQRMLHLSQGAYIHRLAQRFPVTTTSSTLAMPTENPKK